MYNTSTFYSPYDPVALLDKKRKKGYSESSRMQAALSAFDDDKTADSALGYLYAKENQKQAKPFLQSNGFPSAQQRTKDQALYGVQEEAKQLRDKLKSTTNGILNPSLPNQNDRAFLHGLMGDEAGEQDYQNQIASAKRRQTDLQNAFRGSQFESILKPLVLTDAFSRDIKHINNTTNNNERPSTVDSLLEYDIIQEPTGKQLSFGRINTKTDKEGNEYTNNLNATLSNASANIKNEIYNAWNYGNDAIWKGISLGAKAVGWKLTADLLWLAASGSGKSYTAPPGSYASNLAKNDVGINKFVNDLIWTYGTSKNNSNPVIPTQTYEVPLSNGDLGAALHNVYVDVDASRDSNGTWNATVTLTDTFDFTQFKDPFKQNSVIKGLLWFANDIAYFDTKWGLLDPVGVRITYKKNY